MLIDSVTESSQIHRHSDMEMHEVPDETLSMSLETGPDEGFSIETSMSTCSAADFCRRLMSGFLSWEAATGLDSMCTSTFPLG